MKQARLFLVSGAALIVTALPGMLPAQPSRQQAWFPDGTGLEIYTESTGSTKADAGGVTGIGPGVGSKDLVFRAVVDSGNNILFAYNLEASRGDRPGTVVIRIEPLSAAMEKSMLSEGPNSHWPKVSGSHIPTVAAVRELSPVRTGEVVTLDILYNRSTGEKIYDVLRPLAGPSPGNMQVNAAQTRDEVSLKGIALKVNGRAVPAPASWIIGAAVRIDIPGHGAYVVALADPRGVAANHDFHAVAHADGKSLTWKIDGDSVQIESNSNVLTQAQNGVLWVYHDSQYRSQDQPNTVSLQTADSVEWLIPRRP